MLCVPPRHRVPVGAVGPGRRSPALAVDPLAVEVVGEVDGEGATAIVVKMHLSISSYRRSISFHSP